jgi:hypothetical protein
MKNARHNSFDVLMDLYTNLTDIIDVSIGIVRGKEKLDGQYFVTLDNNKTYMLDVDIDDYYIQKFPDNHLGENSAVSIVRYNSGKSEWFPARLNVKSYPRFICDGELRPLSDAYIYNYENDIYKKLLIEKGVSADGIWINCPPVPSNYCLHFNSPLFATNCEVLKTLIGSDAYNVNFNAECTIDIAYKLIHHFGFVAIYIQPTVYNKPKSS